MNVRPALSRRLLPVLLAVLALQLAACGESPDSVLPDPRDGRSGLRMSGTLGSSQIAVNDGLPTINTGDCDLPDGADSDVCIVTEDLSGQSFVLVFENPGVLREGETVPIVDVPCGQPRACDDVTEGALVELRIVGGETLPGLSGQVAMETIVEGQRYRGTIDLRVRTGTLSGEFDVVPRPEELQ